jgi:hypothetical protein
MHIIPTTYWAMIVCELTLAVLTPSQEQVPLEDHEDATMSSWEV